MIKFKYKMRAECKLDVARVIAAVEMFSFTAQRFSLEETIFPDIEIEFVSPTPLRRIKKIIENLSDSHVMVETIALADEYTGERISGS